MTDEEMVAEYLKDDSKYLIEDTEGNLINITKRVREAFLAGRPKWHKVADGDLPKRDVRFSTAVSIPVLTQDYKFACYYFSSLKWYSQGEEVRVIAWYEIPQYKE